MDVDVAVGKIPEAHQLSPATEPASIPTLDGWIESLMNCKQLAESDVSRLCDRVSAIVDTKRRRSFTAANVIRLSGTRSVTRRVQCPTSGI